MLEARDITFGYGKRPVLDGVSLTVGPEERVALVAPSGAGKTTLCRILAGYEQPQKGTVTVDGAPLPQKGRCPVQLIGQHPELSFDPRLTLATSLAEAIPSVPSPEIPENSTPHTSFPEVREHPTSHTSYPEIPENSTPHASFPEVRERPIPHVISSGGAKRRSRETSCHAQKYAHLLDRFDVREEWLTRYPSELSGGELQRLCIVRALAAEPRYLIADEMSVMLDAITQARVWHELLAEAERREMGLVIVSHSPALTNRVATRIVEW